MRIQQPHDSGKKAWKRVRRYMAERSIVCTVFIFIEAITPIKLNAVRDDYSQSVQYSQDHRETQDADVTYVCGVNDLTIWEVYGERVHC